MIDEAKLFKRKQQYEEIKIPEELDSRINAAISDARATERRSPIEQNLSSS